MHNILKTILFSVIESESITKDAVRKEIAGWLKQNISTHSEYSETLNELSVPLTQQQKDDFAKFCP